ncbi:short-chain fatty acyl-CoA regulator family protein [Acetobacter sicerae]|uniref:Short-chain fatty acyl-CoA regulator family protein n=1 Tax=Acetobacter sicerae TaxID=85325 RepID=A0ABS8VZH1_9PROT|nr:helix-turn-helix transcriptional regulator [Acetobacter sicerae]MCE0744027.1 short-chain fatty acyl-CoA regulator family protein [Acetobacter sicerae]
MSAGHKKLFAGSRIRKLRRQFGHTQREMARLVNISSSYLNQLENDLRPIPAQLLLTICRTFAVDASWFGDNEEIRTIQMLREVFADPMFKSDLQANEFRKAAQELPGLARHFIDLYRSYRTLTERRTHFSADTSRQDLPHIPDTLGSPHYEAAGEWVQSEKNYFHDLDTAAEDLYEAENFDRAAPSVVFERYLLDHHAIRVTTNPDFALEDTLWRFDRREKTLHLSADMAPESRSFCLARLIGDIEFSRIIDKTIRRSGLPAGDAQALVRVSISNYFAGALILPYGRFRQAARETRHDLDLLQRRFKVSFEQVCHRLSTLQRPGAEGIPFYFIKTDVAGNILKSYSATRFSRARFGGLCALWNVFESFAVPGRLATQLSQDTDGSVFISVARTVGRPPTSFFERTRRVAIVLGCSVTHASEIIYSTALNVDDARNFVPIGPGCRACSRIDCRHRAVPASGFRLDPNSDERGTVPYRVLG